MWHVVCTLTGTVSEPSSSARLADGDAARYVAKNGQRSPGRRSDPTQPPGAPPAWWENRRYRRGSRRWNIPRRVRHRHRRRPGTDPSSCSPITRTARSSAVKARTACINELKTVLLTAPPSPRDQFHGLTTPGLIKKCAVLRAGGSAVEAGTKRILRSLAHRYQHLSAEARAARADPDRAHPAGATPTSWPLSVSDPTPPQRCSSLPATTSERVTTEARFAALCGANPTPASSGQTDRMRLEPRRRPPAQRRAAPWLSDSVETPKHGPTWPPT